MSAAKVERFVAGHLNYRGDLSSTIVGELHGPTTYGKPVVATAAVYDPETDRTRVTFSHVVAGDEDRLALDADGQVRVRGVE